MTKAPKPVITGTYPSGIKPPVWQGPGVHPPVVAPAPGPYTSRKTGMPKMPSVFTLFHKPRTPGNRSN